MKNDYVKVFKLSRQQQNIRAQLETTSNPLHQFKAIGINRDGDMLIQYHGVKGQAILEYSTSAKLIGLRRIG